MGNGQDWVGIAARLDGETDTVPKEGTILISETNINNNPDYIFRQITSTDSTMNFAYMTK